MNVGNKSALISRNIGCILTKFGTEWTQARAY